MPGARNRAVGGSTIKLPIASAVLVCLGRSPLLHPARAAPSSITADAALALAELTPSHTGGAALSRPSGAACAKIGLRGPSHSSPSLSSLIEPPPRLFDGGPVASIVAAEITRPISGIPLARTATTSTILVANPPIAGSYISTVEAIPGDEVVIHDDVAPAPAG
jgi:hypothetical protein